jgi:hypothetical protein
MKMIAALVKKLLKRESFVWQNASMVHLFSSLSYNMSKVYAKASSPHSAISFKGAVPADVPWAS